MAENTTVAVDLAKSVFEIAVSPRPGRISERHRLSRSALQRFFAVRPAATVVMEACGSAHFWVRELERGGHSMALLPPQHVRRYRPPNKTDRADAKALREPFRNEEIRPVPVESVAQQELAALHLREAWTGSRTARLNTLRGLQMSARVGHNRVTVALAGKLARYAWAVATRERDFTAEPQAA